MRRHPTLLVAVLAVLCAGVGPAGASSTAAVSPSTLATPTNFAGTANPALEAVCGPALPGTAQCLALRYTAVAARPASSVTAVAPPLGYSPADLQSAYALPTGSEGSGLTVAIVDAYDLPTAESDLAAYRSYYGLPPCTTANGCFRKVNQSGVAGSYPKPDTNWGQEIALDIDMVSAVCPYCKILLVEANTSDTLDLGASVNTAVSLGAVAVSNSYAGAEGPGQATIDSLYYNHPGVAITAGSGDCGYSCESAPGNTHNSVAYPAASQYVIAVGGTTLTRDGSARGWTESAWGNATTKWAAGSGCSASEPKPTWQHDPSCANRTVADVSAVADGPNGVAAYVAGTWLGFGGTSVASPIIASIFALAGAPTSKPYPANSLYANASTLNDVVGGNNDVTYHTCTITYLCNGVTGYDGPTGLGTPNGTSGFAPPTHPAKPTNLVAIAGNKTVNLAWTAPDDGGSAITGYAVTETEHGLGGVACSMKSGASCSVGGLTNGTEYTFTVHATNIVGPVPSPIRRRQSLHTPVPPTTPSPRPESSTRGPGAATSVRPSSTPSSSNRSSSPTARAASPPTRSRSPAT